MASEKKFRRTRNRKECDRGMMKKSKLRSKDEPEREVESDEETSAAYEGREKVERLTKTKLFLWVVVKRVL